MALAAKNRWTPTWNDPLNAHGLPLTQRWEKDVGTPEPVQPSVPEELQQLPKLKSAKE
jgi:hypothetical protein